MDQAFPPREHNHAFVPRPMAAKECVTAYGQGAPQSLPRNQFALKWRLNDDDFIVIGSFNEKGTVILTKVDPVARYAVGCRAPTATWYLQHKIVSYISTEEDSINTCGTEWPRQHTEADGGVSSPYRF